MSMWIASMGNVRMVKCKLANKFYTNMLQFWSFNHPWLKPPLPVINGSPNA